MAVEALVIGIIVTLLAYAFVSVTPGAANALVWGRIIISGVVAVLTALFLLSTNTPGLMLLGGIVLFLVMVSIFVLEPQEEVW